MHKLLDKQCRSRSASTSETVKILISQLLQKLADLDLHCLQGSQNAILERQYINFFATHLVKHIYYTVNLVLVRTLE